MNEKIVLMTFLAEHHLLDAIVIATMGGIVNYLLHGRQKACGQSRLAVFARHVVVSMFTGLLVGLLCVDFNASTSQTLFFAGIAGTSGSEVILLLQEKVVNWVRSRAV